MSCNAIHFRRAIDQEKGVYKESFEKLRVLKPEIEHIGKVTQSQCCCADLFSFQAPTDLGIALDCIHQMIEKARATMQSQFDQWYANLHARNGVIGPSHASTHGSAYADHPNASNNSSAPNNSAHNTTALGSQAGSSSLSQSQSLSMSMSSDYRDGREGDTRRVPSLSLDAKPLGAGSGGARTSAGSVNSSVNASTSGASMLADSKVADEEVNEDIQAFYQAKEELLRRRGAKN